MKVKWTSSDIRYNSLNARDSARREGFTYYLNTPSIELSILYVTAFAGMVNLSSLATPRTHMCGAELVTYHKIPVSEVKKCKFEIRTTIVVNGREDPRWWKKGIDLRVMVAGYDLVK